MMAFKENSRLNTDRVRSSGSSGSSGGGSGLKIGGGLGGIVLVLAVGIIFGQDGINVLNQVTGGGGFNYQQVEGDSGEKFAHCKTGEDANTYTDCNMVATANSLDYFWQTALPDQAGIAYTAPKLDLFKQETVSTGCGSASQAVGPFYCPADQVAYVQTGFFDTMKTQLGATGGQSAEQYVLAHEYGHHIQNLLGNLKYSQYDPQGADSGAVRVELQADCYAGVWARGAQEDTSSPVQIKPFSSDDLERIINATEVIGDDHIQMTSQGHTDSSTYTHGTSAQRTAWFMTGYKTADMNRCNTFQASDLNNPKA
ncbi:neutral zinc metallopeptidase [Rothia sp. CCM 9416]|uniref:KPN_02809 family neutral zinc metallopeptidase n=1 Tax=Rothia sp. CCM 9416 TaxID=3402655 RepID=UPI003AECCDA5